MARQTDPNPLQDVQDEIVQAMRDVHSDLKTTFAKVKPLNSVQLTPQEEELVYEHPRLRYPGATDPKTGMPLNNSQAAQRMLQEMGPAKYVAWIEDVEGRRTRREDYAADA